ncbi:MAG: peptide ABC transporter substrate-binding protein [Candidatus Magasanikbacteria bacterium]|jgi:peptide/nickel transport system substrate-binding protein
MSWNISSLFARFKRSKKSGPSSHLDLKLLRQIKPHSIPSWSQFKYLGSFLNTNEKKAVWSATGILFLTLICWTIYAIATHSLLTPKAGGEYSEALIGQPKYINPLFASTNDVDADLSTLMYSGLFKYDNNKKIIPDLAEKYTIAADQKTYDIELKKDLKWSDGEPITVDDILYTFETLQNAETGSPLITSFQGVRVNKTSENSVRFTLKTAYAPFLDALTLGILPEHIWAEIPPANIRLAKFNIQPIGSGAWKFEKMVKDNTGNIQSYNLINNENYYGKKPYLKNITFKFFSNQTEAVASLRSQNVLALSFVPHNLKDKVSGKNLNIFNLQLPQYTALFFNESAMTELKDSDLRLALAQAVDKNALIQSALDGDGAAIDAPILPGNLGYNKDIKKIPFNLASANQLLDKKWPRIQPEEYFKIRHDQILKNLILSKQPAKDATVDADKKTASESTTATPEEEQKIGEMIRAEMTSGQSFYRKLGKTDILRLSITTADTPEYVKTSEEIAKMWQAVGIQTNLVTVSSRQIVRDTLKDRTYQVLIYGEMMGSDSDLYSFWHSSQSEYPGLNLAKFSDRDADKLLEDARTTLDTDLRAKLYQKFQDILAKDIPAVFLYSPTYIMAVSKDIRGINLTNIINPADRFGTLNEWYTKTKRQIK